MDGLSRPPPEVGLVSGRARPNMCRWLGQVSLCFGCGLGHVWGRFRRSRIAPALPLAGAARRRRPPAPLRCRAPIASEVLGKSAPKGSGVLAAAGGAATPPDRAGAVDFTTGFVLVAIDRKTDNVVGAGGQRDTVAGGAGTHPPSGTSTLPFWPLHFAHYATSPFLRSQRAVEGGLSPDHRHSTWHV